MTGTLPLGQFYQFGYLAHDLGAATAMLGERFGIRSFRRKQQSPWMKAAHAWTGATMLEVMEVSEGAPAIYTDNLPEPDAIVRLHHLGYKVEPDQWTEVEAAIAAAGIGTEMTGSVMDGQLRYAYADTRRDLGIYTEFVCLSGAALSIYDDVPRH